MNVVLHIGTEKTGTSTLQQFLFKNRQELLNSGVYVPTSPLGPDAPSHLKLAVYGRNDSRPQADVNLKFGIRTLAHFRAQFAEEFLAECSAAQAQTIVMSSEHCSSRLNNPDEVCRLREFLERIGETTVLVYLRRQDQLLTSSYATKVRLGSAEPLKLPTDPVFLRNFYDYQHLCDLWSRAFGKDNLKVRIYSSKEFVDGDLLHDYLASCGFSVDLSKCKVPAPQNESLDLQYLEFLRRFNVWLPNMGRHTNFLRDPRQGNLIQTLDRLAKGQKLSLPPDKADAFLAQFEQGNQYVARAYLGREDGRLFEPPSRGDNVAAEWSMSLDDAFRLFAEVWAEANQPPKVA